MTLASVDGREPAHTPKTELRRFLQCVFGYCSGHVAVRMLRESGTADAEPKSLYLPCDPELSACIADQLAPAADDMRGVYVVPCTIRQRGNAKADNILETCVIPCDLDHGDIRAKQDHLERHLGPVSMVVLSGGRTERGEPKRHLYWRLTEACSGTDLDKVVAIRRRIVAAVGADDAFERLTQPIRVAGSIHGKNGSRTPVCIERSSSREYDLEELLDAAERMPNLPGAERKSRKRKVDGTAASFAARQKTQVRAGGLDEESRFDALSGTIGHWVRLVRLGHSTLEEASAAVSQFNQAQVSPPWPEARLRREFGAILNLDRSKHPDEWAKRTDHDGSVDVPAPENSEDALAKIFITTHGDDWRHVASWGQWLHWSGTTWKVDHTQRVLDAVRRVCRSGAVKMKSAEARRIASARTVKAVERLASSDPRVAVDTDAWDAHPDLLNTPSGTIDLSTGEIGAAHRVHHLTQITAASPGPTRSLWLEFLQQITGSDPSLMAYLARVCGYCLSGDTSEQVFFFFHGEGGNGKSVFVQTVAKAIGSYAATAPLDSFTVSRTTSHPTDLAGLRGKRLVTVTETEQGRAWAESRIKAITGGEPIRARLLYRDFFEFQPSFKLIVVGNHRPQLTSVGTAMRRRLQLVPFEVTIPEEKRDKALARRLEAELDGILGWMLDGHREWQRQGLAPPGIVTRASEEYFGDEDLVGQWIDERCDVDDRHITSARVLFESWTTWAEDNGADRGSQKFFGEALRSRGFTPGRTRGGRHWQGLSLRRPSAGAPA